MKIKKQKSLLIGIGLVLVILSISLAFANGVNIEKDFRYTNVNFVPMDPGVDLIPDTEDDVQLPAELGDLLPGADVDGKYDVRYVIQEKNNIVKSTNPGQVYEVLTIRGEGIESIHIDETFGVQFDKNPGKLGGGIEVIIVDTVTGLATVITDTGQVTATVNNVANTVVLDISLDEPLGVNDNLMVYDKFKTALKHSTPDYSDFVNTANVTVDGGELTTVSATIEFV